MCGIFGILQPDDVTPCERRLGESLRCLGHRGPDAEGRYAAPHIGLVHARLSLVDPDARSHQPMWDPTGRYALVYNGEVYNFRDLRVDLERRGVVFRTTGDTEVVLHSLIQYPTADALRGFDGMFALALYDALEGTLSVARDRFGIKPLYYLVDAGRLLFASEVKAFRPWRDLEAEPFSVASYLAGFGGPTSGATFFRGVRALAPGSVLVAAAGRAPAHRTFFTLPEFWNRDALVDSDRQTPATVVDRTEALLAGSVERQLFADARVGAFCSGGVDSSLIVAMASKTHRDLAVFHANVVGRWSEVSAARQLASHLKLDLHVVDVRDEDFVSRLPEAMWHYEHPYTYLPNAVPFMLVARLARTVGVKGLLSGEGSDELFLGYPWFWRQPLVDAYGAGVAGARRWVRRVPAIGPLLWPHDGDRARLLQDLFNQGHRLDDERRSRDAARALAPRVGAKDIASLDHLHGHLQALLDRNDRLAMAAGVEARFPFLDHAFAGAAINLPPRYKLRPSLRFVDKAHPFIRDKWVVREVAKRWMPKALAQRAKLGFWTTVFERMDVSSAYFDDAPVRALFGVSRPAMRDVCQTADQDLRMRLLHVDVWQRVCLQGEALDGCADRLRAHVTVRSE